MKHYTITVDICDSEMESVEDLEGLIEQMSQGARLSLVGNGLVLYVANLQLEEKRTRV